jgi:transmembrane sensor
MRSAKVSDGAVLEQAAEWMVQINDATATEADFIAWHAWLSESPEHAQAYAELEDAWKRSAAISHASASKLASLDVLREERAGQRSRWRRVASHRAARWAAAASLVFGVAGGSYLVTRAEVSTIQTATAELRSVRLPDGSRAALGPETNVQIAFSERRRSLKMSAGEAYFEVAHAPDRPFSVETPAGRIVAVGTAFSVNLSGKRIAVTVTQGTVRVEPPTEAEGPASTSTLPVLVREGHRLVREPGRSVSSAFDAASDALAWRQGRLEYEGEPLRVVVSDINRYSPTKLRIDDAGLGELRYTGTVFPDSIELWLSSIEGVFPLRVTERQGERVIVRAGR